MGLKPEVKVKVAGIGSFSVESLLLLISRFCLRSRELIRVLGLLLTTEQACPLSWVSSLVCTRFYDLYVHCITYIVYVRTDVLQNVVSYRREFLLNGILVIWTVVSLIACKLRLNLFPVLCFNFLRTFINPQLCMTSACYMYNYLMTLWNVVYIKKLPVLWNGFSGAGNVKVSCLSQNSQEGQARSF